MKFRLVKFDADMLKAGDNVLLGGRLLTENDSLLAMFPVKLEYQEAPKADWLPVEFLKDFSIN